MEAYFDLGNYGRRISTESAESQLWFNRGLIWTYGYNHEEAIACFRRALAADSGCLLAQWGIAYAIGPHYNKPWEAFEPEEKIQALSVARTALEAAADTSTLTPVEQALISALGKRYPLSAEVEDFAPYQNAFADAMREVYARFPDDLDVCALFAEALMTRTPWLLWDLPTGKPAAGAATVEARTVLETAFAELDGAWEHPGLLHMYVHLMEMSPHPEVALRHGDRLVDLVPDAGHLIHMGTHIDVLCGAYHDVVARNATAVAADRRFLSRKGLGTFYTVYCLHNLHFQLYGAMFLAQPRPAFKAAKALEDLLTDDVVAPMADWFESFVPMKQHAFVRFGMWQEVLDQPFPDNPDLYCFTVALMHYARTVALANSGKIGLADAERDRFLAAKVRVPDTRMLFNNTCPDILAVAEAMMLGELEYRRGNAEAAFDHLRRSVALEDTLPYDEPWGWMQPTRHALGALLMESKRFDEAEAVYRADLGLDSTLSRACQHPKNVWSLHGLHECLSRRGDTVEVLHIRQDLDRALARAHVPVQASCFCRAAAA